MLGTHSTSALAFGCLIFVAHDPPVVSSPEYWHYRCLPSYDLCTSTPSYDFCSLLFGLLEAAFDPCHLTSAVYHSGLWFILSFS